MNRLKELRQEKKQSQKDTALELNMPLRTYQRLENGESQIKQEKAQQLADFFGVDVGYLLGYNENRYGEQQIEKAIKNRLAEFKEDFDTVIFKNTMVIIEQAGFLELDLDTMVAMYFYNRDISLIKRLSDLSLFFDAEAHDYMDLLSIVEPYQADKIIQKIGKLGDYNEQLGLYLNKIKMEEDFFQNTGYPISNNIDNQRVIKIDIPKNTLSDEELMTLSSEKRKEYISEYLDTFSTALSNLSDSITSTGFILANVSSDQLRKLTNSMIQTLAKLNDIQNKL